MVADQTHQHVMDMNVKIGMVDISASSCNHEVVVILKITVVAKPVIISTESLSAMGALGV